MNGYNFDSTSIINNNKSYYSTSGGTLSGNVTIEPKAAPSIYLVAPEKEGVGASRTRLTKNASSTADYGTQLIDYVWGDATNSNARVALVLNRNVSLTRDLIKLFKYDNDGTYTIYLLYGEHNKPTIADVQELQTVLDNKVDKVTGKGLSTNDYTTAEKTKLAGIEAGAQVNTITGVKGNAETNYRTGNVNLTSANIGALPITGGTLTGALAMRRPSGAPRIELFTLEKDGVGSAKTMLYKNADDSSDNGTTLADFVWGDGSANNKSVRLVLLAASAYPSNLIRLRYDDGAGNSTLYRLYGEHYKPPLADITGLEAALAGKSDTGHTHGAGDIISGTLNTARLPTVPITKGGTGATDALSAITALGGLSTGSIGTPMASGDNIDNYTTPGTYLSADATISASLQGTPPYTTGGFKLYVVRGYQSGVTIQLAQGASVTVYCRIKTSSTADWGNWQTYALGGHSHGSIRSDGSIGQDTAPEASDRLVITDASDGNKIVRSSIVFDGTTTDRALTPKGTWRSFLPSNGGTLTGNLSINTQNTSPIIRLISAESETTKPGAATLGKNASSDVDYGTYISDYPLNSTDIDINNPHTALRIFHSNPLNNRLHLLDYSTNGNYQSYKIYGEHNKPTPEDIGAYPTSGGMLSGSISIQRSAGSPSINLLSLEKTGVGPARTILYKNAGSSTDNGTQLVDYVWGDGSASNPSARIVIAANQGSTPANLLRLRYDDGSGTSTTYKLYGEHNKPAIADVTGLVDALASKSDTDTKAVHTESTVASNLPILLSYQTTPVSGTARAVYYSTNAAIKPSTGDISTNGSISATGNITSSGNISGILEHKSGYFVIKPYGSTYDSTGEGSCRIYYNHDNTDSGRIANSLIVGTNTTIISGKISSNGSLLTNLNGSAITTGTVPAARLGTMTGATSSANGTSGAVPTPPTSGYNTKYLRADGTWTVPPNTTYTAASAAPNMDGTATVGTSAKYAREDHVHPSDTTKLNVNNPTGTGYLTLSRASSSGKTIKMLLQKNASDTVDYGTQLIDYSVADVNKYTRLSLINNATLANKLALVDSVEGTKYIYGEHNKPTPADIGAAATSHAHGNITSAGKIGSTTGRVVTSSDGTITVSSTTYDSNNDDPTAFDYSFVSRVKQSASGAVTAVRHRFPIYDTVQTSTMYAKSTYIIGGKSPSQTGEGTDTTTNGSGTIGGITSTYMNSGYNNLGYKATITFTPQFTLPSGKIIYIYNFFGQSNTGVYLKTTSAVSSGQTVNFIVTAVCKKSLMITSAGDIRTNSAYKLEDIYTSSSSNATVTLPSSIKTTGFLKSAGNSSGVYMQAVCDVGTNNRMNIDVNYYVYYM